MSEPQAFEVEGSCLGIVSGRNIAQHADEVGMTRALMMIMSDDATVEAALAIVKVA